MNVLQCQEECIAKGCISTTCKFMNPGSMHATMQENVTVEIKNDNGTVVGTYTKISNGVTTTRLKELKKNATRRALK
jgi:K(+)-stimulated pyrophosphate-energized sodium pump